MTLSTSTIILLLFSILAGMGIGIGLNSIRKVGPNAISESKKIHQIGSVPYRFKIARTKC